ncbi:MULTISPECIES: cytochrome P450 [Thermus]|uniref:cytochrome P450 n=1 Tax=Thermus TaxID=270 RepID=UPI001F486F09|nr:MULTISPECIES: cytochrome P450 [Thermus]
MTATLDLKEALPDLRRLRDDPLETLLAWGERHPRLRLPLPGMPLHLVFDPEGVEAVLLGLESKATFQYRELARLTGQGLLADFGPSWKEARKTLKDPFLPRAVRAYAPLFQEEAEAFFARWRPGEMRDLAREMLSLSLRLLGRALWDRPLPETLAEAALRALERVVARMRNPFTRLNLLVEGAFLRHKRALEREAEGLIQHPPLARLPRERALAEAKTLLIAGHETTASALTWALYLLSQHPSDQARVAEDPAFALSAFQEALRLYPPAWVLTRKAEAPLDLLGERVEAGTTVVLSPYVTHRLHFPEGEAFRPGRFLETPGTPSGRYFPFGFGQRLCLGRDFALLEGEVTLGVFFRRFRLGPLPKPRVHAGVTLWPEGGLPARLEAA